MLQKNEERQKKRERYETDMKKIDYKIIKKKKEIKKIDKKNVSFYQKKYKEHLSINHHFQFDHSIFISLDLAKYGFDSNLKNQSIEIIENLLKINQLFSINPNVEGVMWKQLCNQIIQKMEKQTYIIEHKKLIALYSLKKQQQQQCQQYIQISHLQKTIWQCMDELLTRIKQGSRLPGLFGIISQQIFNARKILQKSYASLQTINQLENWKLIQKIYSKYLQQLMMKTFKHGLLLQDIDHLNYFLDKQYEENNRSKHVQIRITNWQEWANFISKKRVRLRKASKFLLHTACQLCLSPYSQQSNRITNCPQCRMRGHQLCLQTNSINRCGRCIYLRLPNEIKSKISQCFLCGITNLLPLKITSSKFVHVFCILAHGFWKIQNTKVFIKEKQQKNYSQLQTCHFCQKTTKYYTKCEKCNKICHYLCGYMNGANFIIQQNNTIKLQCCNSPQQQIQKLSYQRQYILNYDNIVFKKLGQIKKNNRNKKHRLCKQQIKQQYEFEMDDHFSFHSQSIDEQQIKNQIDIDYIKHDDFDYINESHKSNQ